MNFASTFTQESPSCPGVSFTMRVLNQIARAARDAALVDARAEIAELFAQMHAIPDPELEIATIESAAKAEDRELAVEEQQHIRTLREDPQNVHDRIARQKLDHRIGLLITSQVKPAYIKASLVAIEGLEIDGKALAAPPWDELFAKAPDGLIEDFYAAAVLNSGLTEELAKN